VYGARSLIALPANCYPFTRSPSWFPSLVCCLTALLADRYLSDSHLAFPPHAVSLSANCSIFLCLCIPSDCCLLRRLVAPALCCPSYFDRPIYGGNVSRCKWLLAISKQSPANVLYFFSEHLLALNHAGMHSTLCMYVLSSLPLPSYHLFHPWSLLQSINQLSTCISSYLVKASNHRNAAAI
jgi:hypothetical protein